VRSGGKKSGTEILEETQEVQRTREIELEDVQLSEERGADDELRSIHGLSMSSTELHLFDAINDAIIVHDLDTGKILNVNERMCDMFGYSREEALELDMDVLCSEETPHSLKEIVTCVQDVARGESRTIEWRARHRDGSLFWVEASVNRAQFGETDHIFTVIRDISERKENELIQSVLNQIIDAVHTSENLSTLFETIHRELRSILNSENFCIALYDQGSDTISLPYFADENDSFDSFPSGKTLTASVIKDDKPLLVTRSQIENLVEGGDVESIGTPSEVWLGVPLRANGEVIGALIVQDYHSSTALTEKDREILEFVSSQVGLAIERKRFVLTVEKKTEQLEKFLSMARKLTENLEPEDVLGEIVKQAKDLFRTNGCTIYSLEANGRTLKPIVSLYPPYDDEIMSNSLDVNASLTGKAVKVRKSLVFNNAENHPDAYHSPNIPIKQEEHVAVAPIIIHDQILGAFWLFRRGIPFCEEDLTLIDAFADYASVALRNARTYDTLRGSEARYRALFETANQLTGTLELNEVLQEIGTHARNLMGCNGYIIFSLDEDGKILIPLVTESPFVAEGVLVPSLRVDECLTGKAIKEGKSLIFNRADDHPEGYQLPNAPIIEDDHVIVSPFIANDQVLGALWMDRVGTPFTEEDRVLVDTFAAHASIAFRNAKVHQTLLSEVKNRRQAEIEYQESEHRYRTLIETSPEAVVTLDIKGFITSSNKAAEDLVGDSSESIVGRHFTKLGAFKKREIPKYLKLFGDTLRNKQIDPFVFEFDHRDGTHRFFEVYVSLVRNNGKISYIQALARDITHRKQAEEQLRESFEKLQKTMEGTIYAIARTVETRDPYTAGHQRRVAQFAVAIAQEMRLTDDKINAIHLAAMIHDIGKINVPTEILSKPGELSEAETELIRIHPQVGYEILHVIDFPWPIADIVLQHHERMDGSGYPNGIKGDDIILESRILGVADVVEAMSSHRPYRSALGLRSALKEITMNKGTLYDPDVVDACIRVIDKQEDILK
jgi:PAS domain S-box-containing protein/putative nucleotidyltransferase with HDIG domain